MSKKNLIFKLNSNKKMKHLLLTIAVLCFFAKSNAQTIITYHKKINGEWTMAKIDKEAEFTHNGEVVTGGDIAKAWNKQWKKSQEQRQEAEMPEESSDERTASGLSPEDEKNKRIYNHGAARAPRTANRYLTVATVHEGVVTLREGVGFLRDLGVIKGGNNYGYNNTNFQSADYYLDGSGRPYFWDGNTRISDPNIPRRR